MTAKEIIEYPAASLRKPTRLVNQWPLTEEVLEHIRDLESTLKSLPGALAIASNQITEEGWRIFLDRDGVKINPFIEDVENEELELGSEGCLSFPGVFIYVRRHKKVTLSFTDIDGLYKRVTVTGMKAREYQHECDHLNGKLFIDKLSDQEKYDVVVTMHNRKNFLRGFSFDKEDSEKIDKWLEEHKKKCHFWKPDEDGEVYQGAIGGALTFEFTPTSIGEIMHVRCSCNEKFYVPRNL